MHAGGEQFEFIACLNDSAPWITALSRIAQQHMQGWPTQKAPQAELDASLERAKAVGAQR